MSEFIKKDIYVYQQDITFFYKMSVSCFACLFFKHFISSTYFRT